MRSTLRTAFQLFLLTSLSLSMACEKSSKSGESTSTTAKRGDATSAPKTKTAPALVKLETSAQLDWSWAPEGSLMWIRAERASLASGSQALALQVQDSGGGLRSILRRYIDRLPRFLEKHEGLLDPDRDLQIAVYVTGSADEVLLAMRYGLPIVYRPADDPDGRALFPYPYQVRLAVVVPAKSGEEAALRAALSPLAPRPRRGAGVNMSRLPADSALIELSYVSSYRKDALPEITAAPPLPGVQLNNRDTAAAKAFATLDVPFAAYSNAEGLRRLGELGDIETLNDWMMATTPENSHRAQAVNAERSSAAIQYVDHPATRGYDDVAFLAHGERLRELEVILSATQKRAAREHSSAVSASAPTIEAASVRLRWSGELARPNVERDTLRGFERQRELVEAELRSPYNSPSFSSWLVLPLEAALFSLVFAPEVFRAGMEAQDVLVRQLAGLRGVDLALSQKGDEPARWAASLLVQGARPADKVSAEIAAALERHGVEHRVIARESGHHEHQLARGITLKEAFAKGGAQPAKDAPLVVFEGQAPAFLTSLLGEPVAALLHEYHSLRVRDAATYRHIQLGGEAPRALEIEGARLASTRRAPGWRECQLEPMFTLRHVRRGLVTALPRPGDAQMVPNMMRAFEACVTTHSGAESEQARWALGQMITTFVLDTTATTFEGKKARKMLSLGCELGAKRACAAMGK